MLLGQVDRGPQVAQHTQNAHGSPSQRHRALAHVRARVTALSLDADRDWAQLRPQVRASG